MFELNKWSNDSIDEEVFEQRQRVLEWAKDKMSHMQLIRDLNKLEEERARRNE